MTGSKRTDSSKLDDAEKIGAADVSHKNSKSSVSKMGFFSSPKIIPDVEIKFGDLTVKKGKKLASGSTCEVYEATAGSKVYALKDGLIKDVGTKHEREIMQQLQEKFWYKADEASNKAYYLMDKKEGIQLGKLLQSEFEGYSKLTIAFQSAQALYELHRKSVVHADITLENFIFDKVKKSAHVIDYGTARIMTGSITNLTTYPNTNSSRKVNYCYELDIINFAENVLDHLKATELRDIVSQSRQPILIRPSLPMILSKINSIAVDAKVDIWREDQVKPTKEMCDLLYKVAKAVNEYRHHYMSIKGPSLSHSKDSVFTGEKLVDELLNLKSEQDMHEHLSDFLEKYSGGTRAHSLKVLLAESVLDKKANNETDRAALINELVDEEKKHVAPRLRRHI